jgi:hypothetical protein
MVEAQSFRGESPGWWTKEWFSPIAPIALIAPMLEKANACRPRKKTGFRSALQHLPKVLASRYYQLMSGHALIAPYMKENLHKTDSDECWWCETGSISSKNARSGRMRSEIFGGRSEGTLVGGTRGGNPSRSYSRPRKPQRLS